jgi:hypothetical protein
MKIPVRRPVLLAGMLAALAMPAAAQELVVTTSHDLAYDGSLGEPVVVIADLAGTLAAPPLTYVAPQGSPDWPVLKPHGLSLLAADRALVGQFPLGGIGIIDTVHCTLVDHFTIPAWQAASDGYGTLALNPAATHLLVISARPANTLFVVPAPFSATSTASLVALPSSGGTAQTHGIAFEASTGRAFVGHQQGVSVLDPPYATIAFTIPLPPGSGTNGGRAVALAPDGQTLLSTIAADNKVAIVHAPFSAAAAVESLQVNGASQLDAMSFVPDGSEALVVDVLLANKVFALHAPFSAQATVDTLVFSVPPAVVSGYEDIDISNDGRFAALSGGTQTGEPLIVLEAPFSEAGVSSHAIAIAPLHGAYNSSGGRGTGTARFWSAPVPSLPQIDNDGAVYVLEGDSGTTPATFSVRLSRAATQPVSVAFATRDGSLHSGQRYVATSGTLTFNPGQTLLPISVPVIGNTVADGDGYFYVDLGNPVNATLIGATATVTLRVRDNDGGNYSIATPSPLPDGFVGAPYLVALSTAGGAPATSWGISFGSLPPGLGLDTGSGVISGTPTTEGIGLFSIFASNGSASTGLVGMQIRIGSDRIFADGFEAALVVPPGPGRPKLAAIGACQAGHPRRGAASVSKPDACATRASALGLH